MNAIAAGNCAVLKPSELTPNTSMLMGKLVARYLDQRAVQVINGGVPETTGKRLFFGVVVVGSSINI